MAADSNHKKDAFDLKGKMDPKLESLYKIKEQKLREQKQLSDEASGILNKLNNSSSESRKNLTACVAVSRQAGNLHYYEAPDEVKSLENEKVINKLAAKLRSKHKELEELEKEIIRSTPKCIDLSNVQSPPITSISQWFDLYGRAHHQAEKDMLTTFSPAPKIYGGTAHHRSFKTQSSVMRKGHLTR